jgi:hypothetical protein
VLKGTRPTVLSLKEKVEQLHALRSQKHACRKDSVAVRQEQKLQAGSHASVPAALTVLHITQSALQQVLLLACPAAVKYSPRRQLLSASHSTNHTTAATAAVKVPVAIVTLTGPPVAPSCSLTLTMSMGWMMTVAPMPDRPPFT